MTLFILQMGQGCLPSLIWSWDSATQIPSVPPNALREAVPPHKGPLLVSVGSGHTSTPDAPNKMNSDLPRLLRDP